jgi:hypothetical protein
MQYRITAPVHGHTGIIAGVHFADGTAECTDPPLGAIEYFRRHGYDVVCLDAPDPAAAVVVVEDTPKPAPRSRSRQQRGSTPEG